MKTAGLTKPGKTRPRKIWRELARQVLQRGALAAAFGIAITEPVMADIATLPAIVEPKSEETHVGKIIFVELVTPDLAVSKQFYGGLFGWTFRDIPVAGVVYAEAYLNGDPVAGLVMKPIPAGEHRQPAWLSFFSARDVDATERAAVQHGAKVLAEAHVVPDRGREAVLMDPQGAVFAVLASSTGDPPDVLASPGEWIWSSLVTSDPDTDTAFYQSLFDYEAFDLPATGSAQHILLASDNYARASANSFPINRPNAHPRWINYVRVDDAVKITKEVTALGGRVLVEPHIDRHGGKVAIVADPSGAAFGLMEWPETESKEVTK